MIKKIARDVSDRLNATPSRDFDGMVGLKVHLRAKQSLLHLDYEDGAMILHLQEKLLSEILNQNGIRIWV
ncbi:unnamed protein product [Brassica oleracea var. botrytis]